MRAIRPERHNARPRALVVLAALAGAVFVLLPLGGGALAATSQGANGDVVFVRSSTLYRIVSGVPTSLGVAGVDPSWSPDGTLLAFAASPGGAIDVCTASNCSGTTAQILSLTGSEPVWSRDPLNEKIAYVTGVSIRVVTYPGAVDSLVVAGTDPSFDPQDATKLAYSNGTQIFTCTVTSCGATSTSIANGTHPAWSPDGSEIAYVDSGGGISVTVIGGLTNSVAGTGSAPKWSPEGDSIVYADASGIEVATGSGSSWTVNAVPLTAAGDATPDRQTLAPIPAVAPAVGGIAQTGQQLTATHGNWIGTDPNLYSYLYQWTRCDSSGASCVNIGSSTTANTYAVVSADVGHTLRVIVTATNAAGSAASSPSTQTAVVTTGALTSPANTAYPVITLPTGHTQPNVNDTLSTSNGTWTGSFPMTFTYQWKKCDSQTGPCYRIIGATHSTFTVTPDLYGMTIRSEVTATNSSGAVAQNSESTKPVIEVAPFLRVTPQITGTVMVGQTLALTSGTWDGTTPLTFTYSWRRCDPFGTLPSCVQIATTPTYVPVVADIGAALRVWIVGTNLAGSDTAVTNHTFPVVDKPHFAPTSSDPPLIVGTLEVGGILSASTGTFNGDAPIATTQQWQRCNAVGSACKDIKGATKTVYHPTISDVGSTIRFAVTATNLYGKAVSLSEVTEPIIPQLPHIKGVKITGTAKTDYLIGTIHDDTIDGLGGNDTINGDGGYDTIYGGSGNDVINVAGPGKSHVYGGSGSDTIYAANGEKDVIDCGSGQDRAVIDSFDIVHGCEVVQVGNSGSSGTTPGG